MLCVWPTLVTAPAAIGLAASGSLTWI